MPDNFSDSNSNPEPQPAPAPIPPADPPATAVGVAEPAPAGPQPGWGLLAALPVVLFLLFLTALGMMPPPEPPAPSVNVLAMLVLQSFLYLMLLLYIYSVVRFKHRLPFWAGLRWPRATSTPVGKFVIAGAALAVLVQILWLPSETKLPIERLFHSQEAVYLLAAFGILVAPLVEEVIFRGFLFAAFERVWGLRSAVWSTSVLFAAIHVPQLRGGVTAMVAIFGVGLAFSWIRARTGSLAPPYFMHLAYNSTLFVLLYFATEGFRQFG